MDEKETTEQKPAKVEATPEVNVSSFMRDPKNFGKLKSVATEYGREVRLDGQRIVHNIPADQIAGMIALIK